MTARTNLILGALLLLQAGVIAGRTWLGDGPAPGASRGLLLAGLERGTLERITVEAGNGVGTVHIERAGPGEPWFVKEASDYPADATKVDDTLRELAALELAAVVSLSGHHQVDLKVADDTFDRRLLLEGGGQRVEVLFGTAGRAGSVHARRGGEETVYAVRGFSSWKLSPQADTWLDREYFTADRQRVMTAAIRNPAGEFRLERVGRDWFAAAAGGKREALDNDKVDDFLGKVCRVTMSDVAGQASAMPNAVKDPVVEVALAIRAPAQARDAAAAGGGGGVPPDPAEGPGAMAETRVLRVAAKPGAKDTYYMLREGSDFVAQTSTWALKALLETTVEQLLPSPASPPAGAPGPAEPEDAEQPGGDFPWDEP